MKRQDFRHLERLRVRWAEVDLQKIVFNGHYLMYADTAVAGYWRALALPYHATMEQLQGDLFVRKATLEYQGSAHYDEQLAVGIRCGRIGNSSMLLHTAVFRGETLLVHGELVYVFANPHTMTSLPLPQALRDAFTGFEAGEAMVTVAEGAWPAQRTAARALREQVLVQEHQLPAVLAEDAADEGAVHVLAHNRLQMAVGTGRLVVGDNGVAQIGRMAVLPSVRGAGLGQALVQALLQAARSRGCTRVVLQASTSAVAFYQRLGFENAGAVYEEAGVPHQNMGLLL